MNALTLRGFLTITGLAALLLGLGFFIGLHCWTDLDLEESLLAAVALGVLGAFLVAGTCYVLQLTLELHRMRLPADELEPFEALTLDMKGTLVHFRTGRSWRFWDAVGGKLFLTDRRLLFLAHRGQYWHYRLSIPLGQIANAEPAAVFGGIPGALRITLVDSKQELFTFGAVRGLEADRWAAAILLARYRAHPDWGAEYSA
jgi:hypothetical protein